jgi:ADP-dependent NAD(P)H-hydrate dehydratase / NAD(P)H-hydrate epimerase
MKILTAGEIKQVDAYTIIHEPIDSIDLMERAANASANWIIQHIQPHLSINIFCGTGNNGGDGLAIARLLLKKEYNVKIFILRSATMPTSDFIENEKRLISLENADIIDLTSPDHFPHLSETDIVIDALFGIGLNKPITGIYSQVIKKINESFCPIIAIDIPSGVMADTSSAANEDAIIKATYTLSFETVKLAFMMPENADFVGQFYILSIGLNQDIIQSFTNSPQLLELSMVQHILQPRKPFAHKGDFGHAVIIAGSYGKMGAAVLAAKACLRTGAGLLTMHIPSCGYSIIQTSIPEAMVTCDEQEKYIATSIVLGRHQAIGIGPGLGCEKETANVLKLILRQNTKPMVIDADAINIISEQPSWMKLIIAGSIFTPHPKEFERLAGKSNNQFERFHLQVEFSKRHQIFIVLKGRFTCISCPDGRTYFNSTGNPGMAKGGSGDALTGILTGLLAQGYSPREACLLGVYLHGLAGDLAMAAIGERSLLASDLIDYLGKAYQSI